MNTITTEAYRALQLRRMKERDLEEFVRQEAKRTGWWRHHHLHSRGSTPGWPDDVLIRDDTMILAELKTETGTVSPEQRQVLAMLNGVQRLEVVVWRPRDMDAITCRLEQQ